VFSFFCKKNLKLIFLTPFYSPVVTVISSCPLSSDRHLICNHILVLDLKSLWLEDARRLISNLESNLAAESQISKAESEIISQITTKTIDVSTFDRSTGIQGV